MRWSSSFIVIALAERLPPAAYGVVEVNTPDDPRFLDLDDVVRLR
jgi:hypothetical protein